VFFGDPELEQLPLTELLTVYGDPEGRVNINTAEYEVLDALGQALGQGSLAESVIEERETTPFVDEQDLALRGITPKPDPENPSTGSFNVQSNCFRIRGHGLAGESKVRIDAYVWRDERQLSAPLRVLDWRVLQ
jgi:type II secretory pathway component PulK